MGLFLQEGSAEEMISFWLVWRRSFVVCLVVARSQNSQEVLKAQSELNIPGSQVSNIVAGFCCFNHEIFFGFRD